MTPDELSRAADAARDTAAAYDHTINVCLATGCMLSGSDRIKGALDLEVKRRGLERRCRVRGVGCHGPCARGPIVSVQPHDVLYGGVGGADVPGLLDSLGGSPGAPLAISTDQPFFTRQMRLVLENAGRIDPEQIDEYIGAGGYSALLQALHTLTPADVIEEVARSGLRGRGGAGFPTGLKWRTVAKAAPGQRYVICNADEGDPGAFMDRSVLESDPHRVLEGMAIAGYALGASQGFVYLRAEYPLATERIQTAIRQASRAGLLGEQIGGTDFSFTLQVRVGAGAFVCGEETALIASIEGGRGQPRPRPPYPAESGLWGRPTLINNVETFANIPLILRRGGAWYASIGTETSKGTKVFSLTGCVTNNGVIEVPMGITLREIVYDIGGGIPAGRGFKAIQTGGPSGGCIPAEHLDTPVDYESLLRLGSIMGSGGMIVMDDATSMVEVARYFMEFCKSESCGKCVPCRVGTAEMYDLLGRFTRKEASPADLALLEDLCDVVKHTSLCGLGQAAPNPVLSTLRFFRQEYLDAIVSTGAPSTDAPTSVRLT